MKCGGRCTSTFHSHGLLQIQVAAIRIAVVVGAHMEVDAHVNLSSEVFWFASRTHWPHPQRNMAMYYRRSPERLIIQVCEDCWTLRLIPQEYLLCLWWIPLVFSELWTKVQARVNNASAKCTNVICLPCAHLPVVKKWITSGDITPNPFLSVNICLIVGILYCNWYEVNHGISLSICIFATNNSSKQLHQLYSRWYQGNELEWLLVHFCYRPLHSCKEERI